MGHGLHPCPEGRRSFSKCRHCVFKGLPFPPEVLKGLFNHRCVTHIFPALTVQVVLKQKSRMLCPAFAFRFRSIVSTAAWKAVVEGLRDLKCPN